MDNPSKSYDVLYNKAKEILDRNNPCDFKDGLCRREREKKQSGFEFEPFCCCNGDSFPSQNNETGDHCKHFVKGSGCSVKSLSCITWVCDPDYFENKEDLQKLYDIEDEACDLGLFFPRFSKEETLTKKNQNVIIKE